MGRWGNRSFKHTLALSPPKSSFHLGLFTHFVSLDMGRKSKGDAQMGNYNKYASLLLPTGDISSTDYDIFGEWLWAITIERGYKEDLFKSISNW